MKIKLSVISIVILLILGISGCNEWLDLKPESQIILDEFWQSESDVDAVLAACYKSMTEDAVIYRMIIWGELRSDNMVEGSSINYDKRAGILKILEGEIISTNAYSSWASFYTIINYCNTLIYYSPFVLDRDENFTQDDLNRVKAEALTIRSLAYFYLVRAFKEVPLITDPSIDDTQDYAQPKATERQLLDTIISNLKFAKKYARTDYGRTDYNKQRVTLNLVNALLADVYLWDGQYQNCVNACNEVMADSRLKLVNAAYVYTKVFYVGNSTESIFEIPQYQDENISTRPLYILYGSAYNPLGELSFPETLAYDPSDETTLGAYSPFYYKVATNVYESEDDIRARESYYGYGGKYYIFKYAGKYMLENTLTNKSVPSYRLDISDWIIYRLSDVMLMKAEALVQLDSQSDLNEAITLVNETYLRSNVDADSLKLVNYSTQRDMEKLVLRERQRELLFEGKRWFDLVRLARRDNNTSTLNTYVNYKASGAGISLGASVLDAMYMPIQERELQANSNLEQNPYYAESGSSSRN
ncbi:MAG: RagB/SusD family nutrient uptake outer membrane protein [Paludibacter sp.]|nr:RagB/SusD family nutrient uptake outer membrane protein [Paludibacter sp.]